MDKLIVKKSKLKIESRDQHDSNYNNDIMTTNSKDEQIYKTSGINLINSDKAIFIQ